MLAINDHVYRKNIPTVVGLVKEVSGDKPATVCWGVQDSKEYTEIIPQDQLELVTHEIFSPDDVIRRTLERTGAVYREVKDDNG